MPYLPMEDRGPLERTPLRSVSPQTPAELNFCVTTLLANYWKRGAGRYQQINDILGALESAKSEFILLIARPYEAGKASLNGDIYP